ncbi:hypothetical protein KIV45_15680 [Janthinobacterium lividum]|nr:hypothetical protein KIV45_15680 [Janthinobacterium lividum]
MKNYLKQAAPCDRKTLAAAAGTSVAYLYLIGGGHRRAGTKLCQKLVAVEPKLTLCELRPDIWADGHEVRTRSAADPAPDSGHGGRHSPTTNAIFETVPARAAVSIEVRAKP